ncbi:MAG TPA: retropepsin-like aspartic protease [Streptosporangiaceae bacterium]|nr:retropepsin-like aspartic protease [Streptosporangiaceae bacterium]
MTLSSAGQEIRVRALVDTGSHACIFGRAVADALEIDVGPGSGPRRRLGILGGVHEAVTAHVIMDLPPFEGLSWEADAAFLIEDLDLSFAGVLGQEGFLDKWVASFNYYDGFFVIEERDSFVERLGVDPYEIYQRGPFDSEWERPTPN